MNELLQKLALNTEDPEINFLLGIEYHKLGHTASASSHYLRCAERTDDIDLAYECFIKKYFCYREQQNRNYTAVHLLKQAIILQPKRPEAYYLLARHFEHNKEWYDSYLYASIGIQVCDFNLPSLRSVVEYPGKYGLIYQKAVAAWYWDKVDESIELFKTLKNNYELDDAHKNSVEFNLAKLT